MSSYFICHKMRLLVMSFPFTRMGNSKSFTCTFRRGPWKCRARPDWHLLGTQDFVHYKEYGSTGIQGGTGAILKVDGVYHMFSCIFPENRQIIVMPQVAI